MTDGARPQTATVNGRLWGARARDWAEVQEATARPAYEAVLTRAGVGPGSAYLDLGCGAGLAARLAADRGATVSGVDAAGPLLAIARERTPEGDFRLGDLESLPFADGMFDLVTGFNAFQYAGDPVVALKAARRVARPGGLVAIMVWSEPADMPMASVITALGKLLPPPPPGSGGPFALSGEAALRGLAEAAGLQPEAVFDVSEPIRYPDLQTALRGLNASGVAARAIETAGEDAVSKAHADALAPFRGQDGGYVIGAAFRCLLAWA